MGLPEGSGHVHHVLLDEEEGLPSYSFTLVDLYQNPIAM
jgi:hypothetical protein